MLAAASNGTVSYLATSYQGSVVEALDSTGAVGVTASQLYAPYGGVRYASGALPTDYGYTGQRADTSTGLDYYGARYYDPTLGQFTSADTWLAGGLNRYGYVGGNPTTATDSSGHRDDENSDEGSASGVQGAPPGSFAAGAGGGGALAAFFAWLFGEDEATSGAAAGSGVAGAGGSRFTVQDFENPDTYITYDGDATVTETIETDDGQVIKATTYGANDWSGADIDNPTLSDAGTRYYKNLAQEYVTDTDTTPTTTSDGGSDVGNGGGTGRNGKGGNTGGGGSPGDGGNGGGSSGRGGSFGDPGVLTDAEISDGVNSATDFLNSMYDNVDEWRFKYVENPDSPDAMFDEQLGRFGSRYYFRFGTPNGTVRISGNFDIEAREWQWDGWHPSGTQLNDWWKEIADRYHGL